MLTFNLLVLSKSLQDARNKSQPVKLRFYCNIQRVLYKRKPLNDIIYKKTNQRN